MLLFLTLIVLSACNIMPDPIQYGTDNCSHCQMTIMDQRYGTETVTGKGKVYKFDSVECLVEFLDENEKAGQDFKLVLITPFDRPGNLVDAQAAWVLHSRNLPSPMGMGLTAFDAEDTALRFKEENGGKVYSWTELRENFTMVRLMN